VLETLNTRPAGRWDKFVNGRAPIREEKVERQYRRFELCCEDIKKGETLSRKNLRIVRPAFWPLLPKHWDKVLGQLLKCQLK